VREQQKSDIKHTHELIQKGFQEKVKQTKEKIIGN
jgi:hypothetical protein